MKHPGCTLQGIVRRTLSCLAAAFLLAGCGGRGSTYELADVTRPHTAILMKGPGQGHIHSLTVTGTGKIDGDATLILLMNGGAYKTERLSDAVSFKWDGDWYSNQAEIRYSPKSVKGGRLRLRYRFN